MSRFALCIGINNYPGTRMDLAGCVNDARHWAQALQARGFSVQTLLDEAANRAGMLAAMRDTLAKARSGDLVVLTFAGHGTLVPDASGDESDGWDEALCPHDVQATQAPIVDDEIHALFDARPAGVRVLLIADSCHSGTVTRAAVRTAGDPLPRFLPLANWMTAERRAALVDRPSAQRPARSALRKSVSRDDDLLLAGCEEGPNHFSYDTVFDGQPTGAFSHVALAALAALPAGATYVDWHQAIRQRLPADKLPQTPQLIGAQAAQRRAVLV